MRQFRLVNGVGLIAKAAEYQAHARFVATPSPLSGSGCDLLPTRSSVWIAAVSRQVEVIAPSVQEF